jgi:hypothetical protein
VQLPGNLLYAACTLLGASLAAGCGGGLVVGHIDCDEEMAAAISSFGSPDARQEWFDNGLHIHTFWYDGSGLVIRFTWNADIPCVREDRPR